MANADRLVLLTITLIAAAVWGHFYNRFWYPPDEGNYAHVAERILDGEVLHRDVHDIHFGAINFTNAAALGLFGRDLISLRYPLALIGTLQAILTTWLFLPVGRLMALLAGLLALSLGAIQFLNPTAHWYALFCSLLLIAALCRGLDQRDGAGEMRRGNLLLIGLLIGIITQYRQLNGVFMAMATLVVFLGRSSLSTDRSPLETPAQGIEGAGVGPVTDDGRTLLARFLLLLCAIGLGSYLRSHWSWFAGLLIGLPPVMILLHAALRTGVSNRATLRILWPILVGGSLSLIPIVMYHACHGTMQHWFDDTVLRAARFGESEFLLRRDFWPIFRLSLSNLLVGDDVIVRSNGLFWMTLFFAPPLVGAAAFRHRLLPRSTAATVPTHDHPNDARMSSQNSSANTVILVWLTVAPFAALVAMHYQILIYLFYPCAIVVPALLLIVIGDREQTSNASVTLRRTFALMGTATICGVAIACQAAQPLERGIGGILAGDRVPLVPATGVPRASLLIPADQRDLYVQLTQAIDQQTSPGDPILAVPSNAELYFLTGRRNPTGYFNLALWLQTPADVDRLVDQLRDDPPRLFINHPTDKYQSDFTRDLTTRITATPVSRRTIRHFELSVLQSEPQGTHRSSN